MSARVESVAQGGQILMTEDTYQILHSDPDFEAMIGEDAFILRFASGVELKGVSDRMTMYSMTPASLMMRQFDPIPGADLGVSPQSVDEVRNMSSETSQASSMASHLQHATPSHDAVRKVTAFIFRCCEVKEVREALLTKCLNAKGVPQSGGPFHRRLRLLVKTLQGELERSMVPDIASFQFSQNPHLSGSNGLQKSIQQQPNGFGGCSVGSILMSPRGEEESNNLIDDTWADY